MLRPDPVQESPQEPPGPQESWQIIDSQNATEAGELPAWVRCYLDGDIRSIESLEAYSGKYVFIGNNRGDNFNALKQWAKGFTTTQDLPQLIVQRVEQRLIAAAALYPDDEYGEYFANMIKQVSDGEYPEAVKNETFWVKKSIQAAVTADADMPMEPAYFERYEFLVLISINKEALQNEIHTIMADIKTAAPPTRNQAAAIKKINAIFFEGF